MGETSEVGRGCERRRDGRVRGGLVALCAACAVQGRAGQHAVWVGRLAACCFTTRTHAGLDRAVCATVLLAGATVMGGAVVEVL
jgi:hypothetical protein